MPRTSSGRPQHALAEQAELVHKLIGLADQEMENSIDVDEKRQAAQSIDMALLESDPDAKVVESGKRSRSVRARLAQPCPC